jgi:hypothetical protein
MEPGGLGAALKVRAACCHLEDTDHATGTLRDPVEQTDCGSARSPCDRKNPCKGRIPGSGRAQPGPRAIAGRRRTGPCAGGYSMNRRGGIRTLEGPNGPLTVFETV